MELKFTQEWNSTLQTLYSAVVNEERYIDFMDQTQRLIEARFMVLGMFDPHDPQRHLHRFAAPRAIGLEGAMEFLGLAAQYHSDGSDKMLAAGPQKVILDVDIYEDREELEARSTMKLLREKYDATHIGTVNAQPNNAWVDYFMFAHNKEQFTKPEKVRAAASFFVPHIGIASEIRRAFKLLEQRYQAIFGALNFLRYGVALVLDTGEVLLTNQSFDAMLEERNGLRVSSDKKLAAIAEGMDPDFQKALSETIAAAEGGNTRFRKTVAIHRSNGATPYIMDLAPFCDDISGELNLSVSGALLFMIDPDQPTVLSHRGLSAAFSFTEAEDNVCRQVLDGRTNSEIAETNNVALQTVKSQVSSVFSKARVTDRASLMRLASKISPPIADETDSDQN